MRILNIAMVMVAALACTPAMASPGVEQAIAKKRREAFALVAQGNPARAWAMLKRKDVQDTEGWLHMAWSDRNALMAQDGSLHTGAPLVVMGTIQQRMPEGYVLDLGLETSVFIYTRRQLAVDRCDKAAFATTYVGMLRYENVMGFERQMPSLTLKAMLHRFEPFE